MALALSRAHNHHGASPRTVDTTVLGTTYPFPEIMCESFGHCAKQVHLDQAVRLLVQQMYRPTWEPAQLLDLLSKGLQDAEA